MMNHELYASRDTTAALSNNSPGLQRDASSDMRRVHARTLRGVPHVSGEQVARRSGTKIRHALVAAAVALILGAALAPLATVFMISLAVLLVPVAPMAVIAALVALFVAAAHRAGR